MIRIKHLSGSLQGKTSASGKQVVRIGRAPDCDVRFDAAKDPKVSSHHAEFLFEDGQWYVIDQGSTNGTLVEGERVTKQRLRQGEEIQIGAGGPKVKMDTMTQKGTKLFDLDRGTFSQTDMEQTMKGSMTVPTPNGDVALKMDQSLNAKITMKPADTK